MMTPALIAMLEAERIEEVWTAFLAEVARFGFDRAIYAFTRYRFGDPYGDLDDVLLMSNHDQAYLDAFIGEGIYRDAPMVRWSAENIGAASWRGVAEAYAAGTLPPAQKKVIDFNRRHGIHAGYSVGFKDISVRAKGALGLVARPGLEQAEVDRIWQENERHLLNHCNLLHLKVTNLPREAPASLTHRQREALEWVADGKTTQDIALLMGISNAMVEKHLRLAREALNVETTAHAVAKASRLNQIFVMPQ